MAARRQLDLHFREGDSVTVSGTRLGAARSPAEFSTGAASGPVQGSYTPTALHSTDGPSHCSTSPIKQRGFPAGSSAEWLFQAPNNSDKQKEKNQHLYPDWPPDQGGN